MQHRFRVWLPTIEKMTHALLIQDWLLLASEGEYSDKTVFQQFTGLKDRLGKEIFEGDIVMCFNFGKRAGWLDTVILKKGEFSLNRRFACVGTWTLGGENQDPHQALSLEVVGNIYENPKMMAEDQGYLYTGTADADTTQR